jgi:predicted O-methyltransferase YrrM
MKIYLEEIKNVDLSYVESFFPKKYKEHQINIQSDLNTGNEKGEHYKLLSYLSDLFNGETILDLGTRDGLSSLVLAMNGKNKVITYDLQNKPKEMFDFESKVPNLEFKQMNVFHENIEIFKESRFIFMDLDPHDGVQEKKMIELLDSIDWKGILVADDIEWFPNMKIWFDGLNKIKYNVTKWGHGSGTGIIDFSEKLEILNLK